MGRRLVLPVEIGSRLAQLVPRPVQPQAHRANPGIEDRGPHQPVRPQPGGIGFVLVDHLLGEAARFMHARSDGGLHRVGHGAHHGVFVGGEYIPTGHVLEPQPDEPLDPIGHQRRQSGEELVLQRGPGHLHAAHDPGRL